MKTTHSHTLTADSITARHCWNGDITLITTEIVGDVETEVTVKLTPDQLKRLVQKSGRNALIDAKVIRGKKSY